MRVEGVSSVTAPESLQPVAKQNSAQEGITKHDVGRGLGEKACTEGKVIQAIERANEVFEMYDTKLEFSIHEQTHAIMIKVIRNDEIIREIPPEKILNMVAKMMESAGLIVDEKI